MAKMMPYRTGLSGIVFMTMVILLISVSAGETQDKKLAPINVSYASV